MLYTYDESHLLIADEWFLDQVRSARPAAFQCKTARPKNYTAAITPDIKKVLVFCESGELALVRSLQKAYPEIQVTSGTYGYACVGKDRYPRLKEYMPPVTAKNPRPTFILSAPYADAEFITNAMEAAGLPPTCEYLARPFSTWLTAHKNFQVSRFYNTVVRHYAKAGQLFWLLQTDVMQAVFDNTPYSMPRFIRDLKRLDARVILVSRDSAWRQAVTAQLLHRTGERSVWTKSPNKKILSVREDGDIFGCLDWGDKVRAGNQYLDQIDESLPNCLKLNLEEFASNQTEQLQQVADFVGLELSADAETLDYSSGYDTAPDVARLTSLLQRELIDRLGLHVTTHY